MTDTPRKHILYMYTVQHAPGKKHIETQEEKDNNYANFRNRVMKKSQHAYIDLGESPKLLRVFKQGSLFDSTVEYLVEYNSFEITYGKSTGTQHIETGFKARLKTTDGITYDLVVLRKQYTATMIEVL